MTVEQWEIESGLSGVYFPFRHLLADRTQESWGHLQADFVAKGSLDRKAPGLTCNQPREAGGLPVGDCIDSEIKIEAVL